MEFKGQNLEDKVVYDFFIETEGKDFKGNVLDLGANDGDFLSNSNVFIKSGWSASLVEAGKKPFVKLFDLWKHNENVRLFNIAIGTHTGEISFHESGSLISSFDSGLVSSILHSETDRWRNAGTTFETFTVDCYTYSDFMKNFTDTISWDFITIDIEGVDYDVLTQIDLKAVNCKCLCIEFNGLEKEKYVEYCAKFDMVLHHENPENLIFIKTLVK